METLLNRNGKFVDKDNPKIADEQKKSYGSDVSYKSADEIFSHKYYIFEMASSVLMR